MHFSFQNGIYACKFLLTLQLIIIYEIYGCVTNLYLHSFCFVARFTHVCVPKYLTILYYLANLSRCLWMESIINYKSAVYQSSWYVIFFKCFYLFFFVLHDWFIKHNKRRLFMLSHYKYISYMSRTFAVKL